MFQNKGKLGIQFAGRNGKRIQVRLHDLSIGSLKGQTTREQLIQNHTQGVQIGTGINRLPQNLLGRQVGSCQENQWCIKEVAPLFQKPQTETGQSATLTGHENILRF